ncbi:MAG: signal peptidase I [Spirochaetales bacterium]|nr:signal peptidase I [Spirochaetales bacterium]
MIRKTLVHYGGIAGAVLTAAALLFFSFDILQVREVSMVPELIPGQTIIVNKIAYRLPVFQKQIPSLDDIVVFKSPYDHQLVVKRCKLLPGDPVIIDPAGWLIVGNDRYFLTSRQKDMLSGVDRVPDNTVLVLGDNPFHSVDSRDYGFISIERIRGKVIQHAGVFH